MPRPSKNQPPLDLLVPTESPPPQLPMQLPLISQNDEAESVATASLDDTAAAPRDGLSDHIDDTPPEDTEPDPAAASTNDETERPEGSPDAVPDRSGERLLWLKPGDCVVSDLNGRDRSRLSAAALHNLIASIELAGVVEPIIVRRRDDQSPAYEVVAGARRHAAATLLVEKGRTDIRLPAILMAGDDGRAAVVTDNENQGRERLSAYERGRAFKAAVARGAARSDADLARMLGVSKALVSHLKRLADWPPKLLQAYGSPHAILAVDAERINPLLESSRAEVLEAAADVVRFGDHKKLGRAAVTRRIEDYASEVPPHRLADIVITSGKEDLELIRVTRRLGDQIALRVRVNGDHSLMKQAFARLLEEVKQGRRGRIKL